MEFKLFGKSLFSARKGKAEMIAEQAVESLKKPESKFLPDFQTVNGNRNPISEEFFVLGNGAVQKVERKKSKVKEKKPKKNLITPKGVYEMKTLHQDGFTINTNAEYVDGQIADFKKKLEMLSSEEYDMRRGIDEIGSILLRMENRKKYAEFKDVFEEFPYTTNTKINKLTDKQTHLRLGQIAQFIADMPKEATDAMQKYNDACVKLCGKKAVFYIIADKKDFKKTDQRRDPILLAQSPFAHVWQILGAWDEEMMFLEEL